jgi:glucose-6-phosphate isomerase
VEAEIVYDPIRFDYSMALRFFNQEEIHSMKDKITHAHHNGTSLDVINEKAFKAAPLAHTEGGVPNLLIHIPEMSPFYFGYLVYFFQKACAVSGYLLGVNPFDQPGVEAYKSNMFSLLGKPLNDVKKIRN